MGRLKLLLKKIIPTWAFSIYHFGMSLAGAVWYRFPARQLKVIGVTGTKGKSSTVEILNAILEEAGFTTGLVSTVRFKIASESEPNRLKMTTPGRFFLQKKIRQAVRAGCDYIILEMSSEGVKQWRHKFIALDALLVTNLSPEHIESHGSYENYKGAKLKIARALARSAKRPKVLVTNGDDPELDVFRQIPNVTQISTHLTDASPYALLGLGLFFTYQGRRLQTKLMGEFNLYNILLAAAFATEQKVSVEIIKQALEKFPGVPGRLEQITSRDHKLASRQNFKVIVDYAHTADSLKKVYEIYKDHKIIAVLGGTGGGRDRDRRRVMGGLADKYAKFVVITDEDPYDEDPRQIAEEVAAGVLNTPKEIIMDRREAIRSAINHAEKDGIVVITGKGTDPYIMRAGGAKEPWSDAEVAREEVEAVLRKRVQEETM